MKAFKKTIAMTLMLVMVFSVMNITAFADAGTLEGIDQLVEESTPTPTPTPEATETPETTETPEPSETPAPTETPAPKSGSASSNPYLNEDGTLNDAKVQEFFDSIGDFMEAEPDTFDSLEDLDDVNLGDLDWDSAWLLNPELSTMSIEADDTLSAGIKWAVVKVVSGKAGIETSGTTGEGLIAAAAAMTDGQILVLRDNMEVKDTVTFNNKVRFAGQGYALTYKGDKARPAIYGSGELTVDNITVKGDASSGIAINAAGLLRNVKVETKGTCGVRVFENGDLKVKGLTVTGNHEYGIYFEKTAKIEISNADISALKYSIYSDDGATGSQVAISGGTFRAPVKSPNEVKWNGLITGGSFAVEASDTDGSYFDSHYVYSPVYTVKKNGSLFDVVPKSAVATPDVAQIGSVKYTDLQTALDTAKPGETIKILRDCGDAAATYTLPIAAKGSPVILDLDGKTVTCANFNVVGDLTINGKENSKLVGTVNVDDEADKNTLTLKGKITLGNISMKSNSVLVCDDGNVTAGTVTVDGGVNVSLNITKGKFDTLSGTSVATVTGGVYKTAPDAGFAATGYAVVPNTGADKATYPYTIEKTEPATVSFTAPSGATYMEFFKKDAATKNGKLYSFKYTSALASVALYNRDKSSSISLTNYELLEGKKINIIPGNSIIDFSWLEPGRNYIGFTFADGTVIHKPVYVWPDNEIDKGTDPDYKHYKQASDTEITLLLNSDYSYDYETFKGTELPVYYSTNSNASGLKQIPAEHVTTYNNSIVVADDFLDKLNPGTYYLFLKLGKTVEGGEYDIISPAYKFDVMGKAVASFNENLKEGKERTWSTSSGNLNVYANGVITDLEMDDVKLALDTDYKLSKDGKVATLQASYLKNLSHTTHKLEVFTKYGDYDTLKLRIAPDLQAVKDVTKHTQGSKNTLAYRCSAEIDEVYLTGKFGGKTETTKKVPADKYTLSGDKKTVTLSAAYLNSIGVGSYSIRVSTTELDPDTNQGLMSNYAPLAIITTGTAGYTPRTGDGANIGLWVSLMIMSLMGMGTVAVTSGKKIFGKK